MSKDLSKLLSIPDLVEKKGLLNPEPEASEKEGSTKANEEEDKTLSIKSNKEYSGEEEGGEEDGEDEKEESEGDDREMVEPTWYDDRLAHEEFHALFTPWREDGSHEKTAYYSAPKTPVYWSEKNQIKSQDVAFYF